MTKLERVDAVLAGRQPDRPPVSFWHHFGPDAVSGPNAVTAHMRHVETHDLDFLKVMDDNRHPRPATATGVLREVADLDRLHVLHGDEDSFGRQLDLIRRLAQRYAGQLRLITTVFNPWFTLRQLATPPSDQHGATPIGGRAPGDHALTHWLREAPTAVERALGMVAESLANFTRHALVAGADGVFLSVRDDWVDTAENGLGTYDRLVRPGDLAILAAAQGAVFNILHVCGQALDFGRFAAYPVQALNWADRTARPSIADVVCRIRPIVCAGLDHVGTMVNGSPSDCAREAADAFLQAGSRPLMIAPGCTFDPAAVPTANLHAIRQAAETLRWDVRVE
jgi:uroporphyrinogen decarboxylase